jgi:hypothetical protein
MTSTDSIPPEARAQVECNALFEALRRGDYAAAAAAQEQLRKFGWILTRKTERKTRPRAAVAK